MIAPGLTLKLGLPLSSILFAPHHPPAPTALAPVVQVTPIASVQGDQGPGVRGSDTPLPPVPTTTTTTTAPPGPPVTSVSGLECVVTLSDPSGNVVTYSPGPAVNGACSEGTPEPYTVTGP